MQKLTGEWATSWACADPLGLVDLQRFDYDDGLLAAAGLSRHQVSRLLPPGAVAGQLTTDAGALLGLPAGLPVVVGAGDGQSAGLGCNVTKPGRAYLNLGTGVVSGVYAADYSHDMAYRTMGGPVPGTYILETFIGGGTQNIVWFIENFAGSERNAAAGKSPEQILEAAAADVPIGAGGLLCLPYWTGAMTPYWDGHARGAFVGLSGLHGKAHMYRAILEGIALEQRLLTSGVEAASGSAIGEILMLGGGSRSPLWCQIIADALGRTVKLVREQESTALGAGIHAAAAAGLYGDIRAAADGMTGVETSLRAGCGGPRALLRDLRGLSQHLSGPQKHLPPHCGDHAMKRNPPAAPARRFPSVDIEQLRLMTKAARMHHIQGERQTEIAEKMGISQAGVSRLLRMAEEQGIIRKIVVPPEGLYPDLEDGLIAAYGLDAAYVIDIGSTEDGIAQILGAAAARCLTDVFNGGPVLGFTSWSTTLREMARLIEPRPGGKRQPCRRNAGRPRLAHAAA